MKSRPREGVKVEYAGRVHPSMHQPFLVDKDEKAPMNPAKNHHKRSVKRGRFLSLASILNLSDGAQLEDPGNL